MNKPHPDVTGIFTWKHMMYLKYVSLKQNFHRSELYDKTSTCTW